jgi:hypothetical protein
MYTAQELYTTRSIKRLKKEAATVITNVGGLPNGALINGVSNFYTPTKPITRVDGSALVVGDLWFNPSTQVQAAWNGTYWLTTQRFTSFAGTTPGGLTAALSNQVGSFTSSQLNNGLFIWRHIVSGAVANVPQDVSNYWTFNIRLNNTLFSTINSFEMLLADTSFAKEVNIAYPSFSQALFNFDIVPIGTPGSLRRCGQSVVYSLIL